MSRTFFDIDYEGLLANEKWIARLARSLVADDVADDVTQELWAAYMRRAVAPREPLSWLFAVTFNLIRKERRRSSQRESAADVSDMPNESPEQVATRTELLRFLLERMERLPPEHRELIVLRYFEGLSASEIVRVLQLPPGTVRRRLKQALDELRQCLDDRQPRGTWVAILLPLALGPQGTSSTMPIIPASA
jgi:RNA polymerase sigma factor (sigma-70 family)